MKSLIQGVTALDLILFGQIFGLNRIRPLTLIMKAFTRSADGHLYPIVPLLLLFLHFQSGMALLFTTLAAFALELPLYRLIKDCVKRSRPFQADSGIQNLVAPPDQFSFPSGHTAAAVIMAHNVGIFFPALAPLAYGWAALVGISRVYLGVHYPTDILAGLALGWFCAEFGLWIF